MKSVAYPEFEVRGDLRTGSRIEASQTHYWPLGWGLINTELAGREADDDCDRSACSLLYTIPTEKDKPS